MELSSSSEALAILFGKYVLAVPYHPQYDVVYDQIFRLLINPCTPEEMKATLRRYHPSLIRFYTFSPITRDAAESAIAIGRLESVIENRSSVSPGNFMRSYGHNDDSAQTISLAVDYPCSLRNPAESNGLQLTFSKEWYDFLADRKLKRRWDERLNGGKAYYTLELLEDAPLARRGYIGQSHIVKPVKPREYKAHKHLLQICSQDSWPDTLCKLDTFYPEEHLPDTRSLLVFPDYGISFSYLVYPDEWSDRWLRYTTLWDCVHHLVSAVQFLHAHGVAHLDINPANVALQVEPCSDRTHPDPDSWYTGRHMHPRLTLFDLGSAELDVCDGTDMIWAPAGTPGLVPPEMQLYFKKTKSPSEKAREREREEVFKAFFETCLDIEYVPKSVNSDSSDTDRGDSQPELLIDGKPPPYHPFPADVWAIGNTIKIMTGAVTNSLHIEAMNALATYLMSERPSSMTLQDDKNLDAAKRGTSALVRAVKSVEEKFDLAGTGRVPFRVQPCKNHTPLSPCMLQLPRSPFY